MDNLKDVLIIINKICNVQLESIEQIDGLSFPREQFLNKELYDQLLDDISTLKKIFNTSELNCLHDNASENQKWPLLNLTRQILKSLNYKMTPKRLCNGYKDKKKLFKRIFIIEKL